MTFGYKMTQKEDQAWNIEISVFMILIFISGVANLG